VTAGRHLADAAATAAAGRALAELVAAGDAVGLVGDLGAGKTALVQALVEGLGAAVPATSPTFTLVNEYRGGRLPVWHVDLYRLEHVRELDDIGLDEIVGRADGVALVEWADRFDVLPRDHLRIELAIEGAGRRLVVTGNGPRGRALAAAWLAMLSASP
jgi:tRNA threonylcarbamoyladenosine biosynthesis protein TsaE